MARSLIPAKRVLALSFTVLAAGCASLPRVELSAYSTAYSEGLEVTNSVLDMVAPYERVVIRYAAGSAALTRAFPNDAYAQLIDPSLLDGPSSGPAASGGRRPASPTLAPGVTTPPSTTSRAPASPAAISVSRSAASNARLPAGCGRGSGGPDPYCFEMRDGFADIGDPPLVGAYRNLAQVVFRFNRLLVAYADGVTGPLVKQDLDRLSTSVSELSRAVPISGASAFAAGFAGIVNTASPIASVAGRINDQSELRTFLLANYEIVDTALELMARNSVDLYANVNVGTQLIQIRSRANSQALSSRRRDIRRVIANWTVLLDDNRRLLSELRSAVAAPDAIETRIRNLNDSSTTARIGTSTIKKQIAAVGGPVLSP